MHLYVEFCQCTHMKKKYKELGWKKIFGGAGEIAWCEKVLAMLELRT